jgi:hypothetical protein
MSTPGGTNSIVEKIVISEDRLLAVATAGIHRLTVDATEELLSLWNDHAPLGEYMLGLLDCLHYRASSGARFGD